MRWRPEFRRMALALGLVLTMVVGLELLNVARADDGKGTRGPVAARYARDRFSVTGQVSHLLAEGARLTG